MNVLGSAVRPVAVVYKPVKLKLAVSANYFTDST